MAQLDNMQFERYTMRQGLSDNIVTAIEQDTFGYIWIGTSNGLNRFDGSRFQNYFQGQAPLKQPGNYIHKLIRLPNASLGVVTRRGFMKMDCRDYSSKNYLLNDSTFFYTYLNNTADAAELKNKKYALSSQSGFYVFNTDGSIYFRYDHFTEKDLTNNRIAYGRDFMKLSDYELLLYTNKLPVYFNVNTKKFKTLSQNDKKYSGLLLDDQQWTIRKQLSSNDYLFVSFKTDSLYYFDLAKNKKTGSPLGFHADDELYWASFIFPYNDTTFFVNARYGGIFTFYLNKNTGTVRVNPKKQLQDLRCNWIFKDKENRLWIGTNQGLLKQNLRQASVSHWSYHNIQGTGGNAFFDNVVITGDHIFITRPSKNEALYVIDAHNMLLKKKLSFYNGAHGWNTIMNMRLCHPDTLWISCVSGILWLHTKNLSYGKLPLPEELQNKALFFGQMSPSGEIWLCGYLRNLAACYTQKNKTFTIYSTNSSPSFPLAKPKHIIYDSDENIWFGGHGLSRFNRNTLQFDTLMHFFAGPNKFEDNMLCASSDSYGSLWFHVVDNGLIQYNTKQKTYTVFSVPEGIPSGEILMMSPVIKNKLWLATRQKLICFDVKDHSVLTLDQEDGLPDDNFTGSEIFYDPLSTKMYAAMNNHLVSFPATLKNVLNFQTQLKIDVMYIKNGQSSFHPSDTVYLTYAQNNLTLRLSILDFETKTPYQLSYTLNDTLNRYPLDEPIVHLTNLDYGTNNVSFTAKDKYNKTLECGMIIIISPPFWRTWWFLILSLLLATAVIYLLIQRRLRKLNQEAKLNQQLSEFELKALHAQMNPHFIFNCLNSIKALIMYKRNEEATVYLNKFSSLVRLNLEHSRKQFLSLQQNIDYLKQYIEIEALRFNDLNYEIYIAPDLDTLEIKIAPMLLQPLIENAIWHGLQALSGDKNLRLRFTVANMRVNCEIEDNGVGINFTKTSEKKNHQSIGVENIRQRIKLLNEKYNLGYLLELKDLSENGEEKRGTLARLSFNYI